MRPIFVLRILVQVLPFLAGVICCKMIVHQLGWEIIPLNAIFSSLIGANVFLMGFLISGVMSDYKESEKLPGNIAGCILSIADEIHFIACKTGSYEAVKDRLIYVHSLAVGIRHWLKKEMKTSEIMAHIDGLSREYALLEKHTQPNYIARLKQDQSSLRNVITRIHTIRETSFVFPVISLP